MLAERPWEELPALIAPAMRPGLKALADEMIVAIRATVPAYARPLEGAVAEGVRAGVEGALSQFLDVVEQGHAGPLPERELYAELGRGEAREGRSLEALLAAYRIGARVAWRRAAARARELQLDDETLALLAESIFAYIDELSAASAEGFAREQSAAAGEADRRRAALARLLIGTRRPTRRRSSSPRATPGWSCPTASPPWCGRRARTIAPRRGCRSARSRSRTGSSPTRSCPTRTPRCGRPRSRRAFGRRTAALGPSVRWQEAARSALRATEVHRLVSGGTIAARGLVRAEDHLTTLLIERDPSLLGELAERRLAPLTEASASARGRLLETLEAWLEHHGSVPEVARAIHVHPQTVRYRLNQLRDLFGDELDDPDARFELMVVTRARTLRGESWPG